MRARMKKLIKVQRGFTLVELVIVMALTGVVTAGITAAVLQVFNMNIRTSNHMTAVRQVRNVGFWIFPDVMMARDVIPDDDPATPELLRLRWTDLATNYTHEVVYTLEDMPSSDLKRLQRQHNVNSVLDSTTVAEYIDDETDPMTGEPKTNCDWDGAVLRFTVTANVGGQTKTQEYEVNPRVGT
jgi:prepilin-type N-terminal cleavage/methylation domain-containing protein